MDWRGEWSVRQLAQCRSGDSPYLVVKGFSELLVKLEISLTLSGEIDNSNVKEVEEIQGSSDGAGQTVSLCTMAGQRSVIAMVISVAYVVISPAYQCSDRSHTNGSQSFPQGAPTDHAIHTPRECTHVARI